MRVLVTGGTGKVGHAVARRLVERGDDVVALVRDPGRAGPLLPAGVEPVQGDVTDLPSLRRAAQGVEVAFAAHGLPEQWLRDPGQFERVNAQGAANVVAVAREAGAGRVIHTSTMDVFHADRGGTLTEASLAHYPKGTAYERSKQRAEELVLAEAEKGIEVVIVNPGGVFGPHPPFNANGLDGAIRDCIRGRLPATPPGGLALVFSDDVAAGQIAALERGVPGERYLLAEGFATFRDIFSVVVEESGRGRVPPAMPVPVARAVAAAGDLVARAIRRPPLLPKGQLHYLMWQARVDSTRARSELGVEFRPWQDGMRETTRWIAERLAAES